jgi:transposase
VNLSLTQSICRRTPDTEEQTYGGESLSGWALFGDCATQAQMGMGSQRVEPYPAGFEVIRRHWIVERTFAWICRNHRRSRHYGFLAKTGETLIYVTMIRLMLKRLTKGVE